VNNETFLRRTAERRAQQEREQAALAEPVVGVDDDLVPSVEDRITDTDKDMSNLIEKIDIIDAYMKFMGHPRPKIAPGQRESIKVFCPYHEEEHPSASINLDKQVISCHHENAKGFGGDIYELAAIHFGYPMENKEYKKGENFPNLKRDILGAYGYSFVTVPGTKELYPVKEDESKEEKESESPQLTSVPATVEPLFPELNASFEPNWSLFRDPDWRAILPEKTFLRSYMEECTKDACPENYHLFHGLLALGLAAGKYALLQDKDPVHGNLYVCITGRSGSGKSRAARYLKRCLIEAAPYTTSSDLNRGVKMIGSPGSGEVLVDMLRREIVGNPGDENLVEVRALADYPELAALTSRTGRAGSNLKDYITDIYDAPPLISAPSRSHKDSFAKDPFMSLLTSTQPRIIRDLLTQADVDSGFLTRVNFVWGQEKHEDAFDDIEVDLTDPVGYLTSIHNWAREEIAYKQDSKILLTQAFRDEANAVWLKRYEEQVKTDQTGMLTRLKLLYKKLTLLLVINQKQPFATPEVLDQVVPLMDYQVDCYKIATQAIGETDESELVARITEMIRDHERTRKSAGGMTGREMQQRLKRRKNFSMKQLTDVLNQMEQLGLIQGIVAANPGRGRPVGKRYKIKVD
jgi:energy-coupling factor transporter ATP-binding protein EcfA2